MRLLSLRLENYRRFERAELEFPDGVTGLVGRNGAGKSTLVEAIGWALFGHDASRTGKDHLRRRGATGACRVHLAFELGGEQHEVTRELSAKGQHVATLKVGGRVAVAAGANSAKEATAAVERALRMDREAFFTSLIARQGELNALSDLTPGRRKEVVMRMLRIDAIDGAIALAREEKRRLQALAEGLAGRRLDPGALQAKAQEAAAAKAREAAALAEAGKAYAGVEASLAAVAKARAAAEELRQRHDALLQKAGVLQAEAQAAARAAEAAQRQLADLDLLAAEAERLRPQVEEHARLRAAVEAQEGLRDRARERLRLLGEARRLEQELEDATRRHEALLPQAAEAPVARAELEAARAARVAAEQAVAERRAHLATIDAAVEDARRQVAQAAGRRAELAALGGAAACPTCEQPIHDALPRLLARLDEELGALKARLTALEKKRGHQAEQAKAADAHAVERRAAEDARKKRVEHLFRAETEAAMLQRRRGEVEAQLHSARGAVAALGEVPFDEAAYAEQKRTLAALAKVHERALQLRARLDHRPVLEEQHQRHLADARERVAAWGRAEAERAALAHDPAQRQALEERFLGLQRRGQDLAVEAERRRAAIAHLDTELARLAAEAEEQRALEAKLEDVRRDIGLLDRLAGERDAGLLAEFRSHLMGRVRPALAQRAGDLFRACTEGRYEGLELTEDYDLQVLEAGQALPLARFSGGEADLANLCLRIAVGEVLAERSGEHLGFLVLDEVLGSQDAQRRDRILGALAHLRGRFRQILLITHIEEVKDALEHVVYVEDGRDGASRLAWKDQVLPLAA